MLPFPASFRLIAFAATAATGMGTLAAQETKPEVSAVPLEEPARPKTPGSTEERLISVGQALAAANAELESLREQHAQLKLQMEALGIAAVKGDERSLQQRLLKAVSELRESEKARTDQHERTARLAEAAAAYMARPADPAVKAALNDAIRAATPARQPNAPEPVTLDAARVVSFKSDFGLAVINAGRDSGVRMGAPFNIVRGGKSVANGLVVDVRDRIAGILLTSSNPVVRVGDSVKPEILQPVPKQ
jgi:hypothetical protein